MNDYSWTVQYRTEAPYHPRNLCKIQNWINPMCFQDVLNFMTRNWHYTKNQPAIDGSYFAEVIVSFTDDGGNVRTMSFTDKQEAIKKLNSLAAFI